MNIDIILIISAMLFTIGVAINPFKMGKFSIDLATGASFVFLVLVLLQVIDINAIKTGFLGRGRLIPLEIIIIFFSVAFVSINVDQTGIFDYLAFQVVRLAKGRGVNLFVFFYLFSCLLTLFTSNDIVILTLTPIIFYLGNHAKINVLPLLFAEFFGANTLSMLLYIGNPTNIIIGNALGIEFLDFMKTMWLPSIVAATTNLLLLFLYFRKEITVKYELNDKSNYRIKSCRNALISLLLLISMLVWLIVSQKLHLSIWKITSAYALLFIIKNLFTIRQDRGRNFFMAFKLVPWKIFPFVAVFFILIAGLKNNGVIESLAVFISRHSTTPAKSIVTNGGLGFLLANLINNQPMTILFSNIFVSNGMKISDTALRGGAYAIVIASNLGANLTLIGALAGLMWKEILQTKGMDISYAKFLKAGISITIAVFVLTLLTLYVVII